MKTNHTFTKREFESGKSYAIETCACGQISKRYRLGSRVYQQPGGNFLPDKCDPCPLADKYVHKTPVLPSAPAAPVNLPADVRVRLKPEAIERRKKELIDRGGPYNQAEREFLYRNGHAVKQPNKAAEPEPLEDATNFLSNWTAKREQAQDEVKRVQELMAPYEARYQAQQQIKSSGDFPARLKDALVIINVLFEEMVTAGMRTPGRAMAGRMLFSNGYEETVKQIENHQG